MTCDVSGWHLIPDQVHQTGSWKFGFSGWSQSWNVLKGSLSEDLRESREITCGGGDGSGGEGDEKAMEVKRRIKIGIFMVFVLIVVLGLRALLC